MTTPSPARLWPLALLALLVALGLAAHALGLVDVRVALAWARVHAVQWWFTDARNGREAHRGRFGRSVSGQQSPRSLTVANSPTLDFVRFVQWPLAGGGAERLLMTGSR